MTNLPNPLSSIGELIDAPAPVETFNQDLADSYLASALGAIENAERLSPFAGIAGPSQPNFLSSVDLKKLVLNDESFQMAEQMPIFLEANNHKKDLHLSANGLPSISIDSFNKACNLVIGKIQSDLLFDSPDSGIPFHLRGLISLPGMNLVDQPEAPSSVFSSSGNPKIETVKKFIIVGAGGTSSWFIPKFVKILNEYSHKHLSASTHFEILLIDGDTVEDKNLMRQNFIFPDIGKNKAEILAERYSPILNNGDIFSVPYFLSYRKEDEKEEHREKFLEAAPLFSEFLKVTNPSGSYYYQDSIVFNLVDNPVARKIVHFTIANLYGSTRFGMSSRSVVIDAGNAVINGQVDATVHSNSTMSKEVRDYFTRWSVDRDFNQSEFESIARAPELAYPLTPYFSKKMLVSSRSYFGKYRSELSNQETVSVESCADHAVDLAEEQSFNANDMAATLTAIYTSNILFNKEITHHCVSFNNKEYAMVGSDLPSTSLSGPFIDYTNVLTRLVCHAIVKSTKTGIRSTGIYANNLNDILSGVYSHETKVRYSDTEEFKNFMYIHTCLLSEDRTIVLELISQVATAFENLSEGLKSALTEKLLENSRDSVNHYTYPVEFQVPGKYNTYSRFLPVVMIKNPFIHDSDF